MDPFTLRRRVRDALLDLGDDDDASSQLRALHQAHASAVEEALDANEREGPEAVARARKVLGLVSPVEEQAASELLAIWQTASSDAACRLAVSVTTDGRRVSGLARALLHDPTAEAGGVVALARTLATCKEQRRALAVACARRQLRGLPLTERWVLRREGVALLGARAMDDRVLVAWREVPGHGLLLCFDADRGVTRFSPMTEDEARAALDVAEGEAIDLGALRSAWGRAAQPSGVDGRESRCFDAVIDARLFPNMGGGHAVGTPQAAMLLETLASALGGRQGEVADLVWPGSEAEAFFDLYGFRGLSSLLLLDRGGGEVRAKLERTGSPGLGRGWIESTPPKGAVAPRLLLQARIEDDVWWLTALEMADPAPALSVERWTGEALLPIVDYDGLGEDEQELVAAISDGGVTAGLTCQALAVLRRLPTGDTTPELRAAFAHVEVVALAADGEEREAICDLYGVGTADLLRLRRSLEVRVEPS
jgi:hypothetical protein